MDERILLIRTGGTIDSEPYKYLRRPPKYVKTLKGDDSLIEPTVNSLPNHEHVDHYHWGRWEEDRFVKDSQKFTEQDMKELADLIRSDTSHHHFIITHGTDAMAKNASMLQKELAGSDKVVVFTGAMVPLSVGDRHHSDGIDGLDFSLNQITAQEPGVYVAARDSKTHRLGMFDPTRIEKDRQQSKKDLKFTVINR